MTYSGLRYSDKPLVGCVTARERACGRGGQRNRAQTGCACIDERVICVLASCNIVIDLID